jgi:hypothetical protein
MKVLKRKVRLIEIIKSFLQQRIARAFNMLIAIILTDFKTPHLLPLKT